MKWLKGILPTSASNYRHGGVQTPFGNSAGPSSPTHQAIQEIISKLPLWPICSTALAASSELDHLLAALPYAAGQGVSNTLVDRFRSDATTAQEMIFGMLRRVQAVASQGIQYDSVAEALTQQDTRLKDLTEASRIARTTIAQLTISSDDSDTLDAASNGIRALAQATSALASASFVGAQATGFIAGSRLDAPSGLDAQEVPANSHAPSAVESLSMDFVLIDLQARWQYELPPSAYSDPNWWKRPPTGPQTPSWHTAGWRATTTDLQNGTVRMRWIAKEMLTGINGSTERRALFKRLDQKSDRAIGKLRVFVREEAESSWYTPLVIPGHALGGGLPRARYCYTYAISKDQLCVMFFIQNGFESVEEYDRIERDHAVIEGKMGMRLMWLRTVPNEKGICQISVMRPYQPPTTLKEFAEIKSWIMSTLGTFIEVLNPYVQIAIR